MSIINGVDMPNFTHAEIPPSVAQYMSKSILARVQEYRNIIRHPFHISKADGALIRFDGNVMSEHYVSLTKLSRAVDGFPDCNIFEAFMSALMSNLFGGVGVYFDTNNNSGKPQPMLHLDLRPVPLIWYRDKGKYYYPYKDKHFFEKLSRLLIGEGQSNG